MKNIFNEVTSFTELITERRLLTKTMPTIKEESMDYEPKEGFKNISELKEVEVNMVIMEDTKQNMNGEDYTVKYIEDSGEKYRIPVSILSQLKELLEEMPKLKKFKVKRKGTTREDTRYTVIPL